VLLVQQPVLHNADNYSHHVDAAMRELISAAAG
jgi:hypothetical protein